MGPMRTSPTSRLRRTGLTSAAVALLLTAAACGDGDTATDPVAGEVSASPSASDEPTPDAAGSSAPAEEEPAEAGAVPVYYVGDTGSGPRLFREFRKVSGEPGLGAAEMAASGTPADPDYRSAFPAGGGFSSVTHEGGTIEVALSDESWVERPSGFSDDDAQVAVQSLVYTVQGALQSRDPVVVTSPSGATTLLGVETADGVANADQLEVLSLVNESDIVPRLDGEAYGDVANHTTIVTHHDTGTVTGNHLMEAAYRPMVDEVQRSEDPAVRDALAPLSAFHPGGGSTTWTFEMRL